LKTISGSFFAPQAINLWDPLLNRFLSGATECMTVLGAARISED